MEQRAVSEQPDVMIEVTDRCKPYFDALAGGRLTVQRCRDCGAMTSYEFIRCLSCQGESFEQHDCAGTGTLATWTVVDRPTHPAFTEFAPYVAAYVQLDEGPWITARVEIAREALRADLPVTVHVVQASNGTSYPVFRTLSSR